MKPLSLLLCGCVMSVFLDASLSAAVQPHPTRAGRLVDERDGFRVEYSAGQEAYVEAVYAALPGWREKYAAAEARVSADKDPVAPSGSATDLVAHRDEILRTAAAEIGLPAPTALQGHVYDTMLVFYELLESVSALAPHIILATTRCDGVQVWDKAELARRLSSGETLAGYSWDAQKGEGNYNFSTPSFELDGDQQAAGKAFEQVRLDHSFNYQTGADGVVNLSASFTFDKTGQPQPLQPPVRKLDMVALRQGAQTHYRESKPLMFPVVLSENNRDMVPGEAVGDLFVTLSGCLQQMGACRGYRNPLLLHTILHEVVEVGLIENYIGSADRRWLCDGTANYVAWKIVRDRCGAEVARQAYNLDAQLARYVSLQKQIALRYWRAVENTKEEERETDLTNARYAFATRVVFEMVRRNDESLLPKLFQDVAKTPRRKVRMETVEKAYRKLTGKKLGEVLKYAETAPVPVAAK